MKKIGLLLMAVVLVLGVMGVGYALWYKVLYINGTVNTDNVDAEWTDISNPDNEALGLPPDGHPDQKYDPDHPSVPGYQPGNKDVGWTEAWIDDLDPQILHVELHNVYPCYYNDLQLHYMNTGSVPVKVNEVRVIPHNFTLSENFGDDDGEIWIDTVTNVGDQLDPGEDTSFSFQIHVEQPALENAGRGEIGDPPAYTFDVQIFLVQWNEYPFDNDEDDENTIVYP